MFSRRSILPDTSTSEISQGNPFANTITGTMKWWEHTQDTLFNYITITSPAGRKNELSPQRNVLFIIKCLPSEITGRICLAVSCWMAACVCFWKASLASHLQGSSTTTAFISSPGESKFHISVTDHVESGKAHTLPPTRLFSNWAVVQEQTKAWTYTFQNILQY